MLSSNAGECNSKTSRFIKEQEASGLLRKLGIITPLNKIPSLSDILLQVYKNEQHNYQILIILRYVHARSASKKARVYV